MSPSRQIGLNKKKKELFLAELREGWSVTRAARAAGMSRATAYLWREKDAEFARAWDDAKEDGVDRLEDIAKQRAFDGSDTLVIFLLKANRPDKYRDTQQISFDSQAPLKVTFKITGAGEDG